MYPQYILPLSTAFKKSFPISSARADFLKFSLFITIEYEYQKLVFYCSTNNVL